MEKFRPNHAIIVMATIVICISCAKVQNGPDHRFALKNAEARTHQLMDVNSPLANVFKIMEVGEDDLLISDAKPSLAFYKHDAFSHHIGQHGENPCEFADSFVSTVHHDTLYLVDDEQDKLIAYNIDTGGCISENTNHIFRFINSVTAVHNDLYLTRGYFAPSTQPNEAVFFKYSSNGSLEPLKLRYKDLNVLHFKVPIKIAMGTTAHVRNDTLFFFFPMTHQIWEYNLKTQKYTSINLTGMRWPRKKLENTITRSAMFPLLENLEIIRDFYPLSGYLGVVTFKPFSDNQDWKVRFYTYGGDFLYTLDVGHYVVSMNDNELTELVSDSTKTSKYALRTVAYR